MDFSIIIMFIGVVLITISFFFKDSSKKMESELEDLSFTVYQETNAIKRRLKVVEEELLIESSKVSIPVKKQTKHVIHDIIKNQVLELHKQGYSLKEISDRSSLTIDEIKYVIGGGK
ncbi:hypothetical protein KD050_02080 [Psychrobacillus sp. INOP01]|uniref:hypothetical protein n=1 Tax=Psychrobacillus sp. INOP01 TaxID=2829187 RepID=UPI001BADCFD2|nr:hypothetical protein [Psychrobacillus sp. INOP01]QUG42110.1 hypothetical protein KD050_02080 [Psychrobacillus sp. INOP01]